MGRGAPSPSLGDRVSVPCPLIHAIQADDKFKARLSELGVSELSMSPAEFGQFIAEETAKWHKVVQFAGLKAQ